MLRAMLLTLAREFDVRPGTFQFLAGFVLPFGPVKGALNFVAGGVADHIGRKPVLFAGWVIGASGNVTAPGYPRTNPWTPR